MRDTGFGLSKRVSCFSHREKLSAELTDEGVGIFKNEAKSSLQPFIAIL